MKVFPIRLFVLSMLLPLQVVMAVPDKKAISEQTLRFAMLDLDRQQVTKSKAENPRAKKRSSKTKSTTSPKRAKNTSLNCLTWSAAQINHKAKRFDQYIIKYAHKYRIDKDLVKAIIIAESCFKVRAKSHANAQGLMQLIPATARRFGVRNSYSPSQNISGGIKYLRFLKDRYKGDLKKTIAAYNAGEGAVDRHKGIPPYKETKKYVKNVLNTYVKLNPRIGRVYAVYQVPKMGNKAGRHGWQYNRRLAPHLYKK